MLLPVVAAPLLVVLGGLATIVGARPFARTMFTAVAVMVLAPVVLGPLLAAVPSWLLLLALPAMSFMLVGAVVTGLFGQRVWDMALGRWIARFLAPAWILATVVALVFVLV
jgi:hypothetical protein